MVVAYSNARPTGDDKLSMKGNANRSDTISRSRRERSKGE
jgi:hypothetical protein